MPMQLLSLWQVIILLPSDKAFKKLGPIKDFKFLQTVLLYHVLLVPIPGAPKLAGGGQLQRDLCLYMQLSMKEPYS